MPRNKEGSTRTKDGKLYARVTYQDDNGKTKEVWRKAENLTHSKELRKQILRDLDDHGSKHVEAERMTFQHLANYYIENYLQPPEYIGDRKVFGLRSYDTAQYNFQPVVEYFASKPLRSITHSDIQKYRLVRLKTPTKAGKQRSIATVNRELAYLRRAFEIAKREGWIIRNPFMQGDSLISIADERKRERILTREEEIRLLEACIGARVHLRPIIVCALDSGMRQGEIFKLKWRNINFYSRLITIEALNTKTLKQREIAMTKRLERELFTLYQASDRQPSSLVFGVEGSCRKAFTTLRRLTGLQDVRFHDLRHTCATRLVQAGIALAEVARILGHNQIATTFRYINADAATAKRVASALDAFNLENDGSNMERIN